MSRKNDEDLYNAVFANDIERAKVAIDKGADLEAQFGDNSETVLHLAANYNFYELAGLLLDRGAEINARDYYGNTPLHTATRARGDTSNLETVNLLIARGADVNARDNYENTPLKGAALSGWNDVVKVLINAGADVNARGYEGNTPLHNASSCWSDHHEVVRTLLDNGANIWQENSAGRTALGAAEQDSHSHRVLKAAHSKEELLDTLSTAWKPSDCKGEVVNESEHTNTEKRQRKM